MKKMTERSFMSAVNKYRGFCIRCKKTTRGETEPDARGYLCPKCKSHSVYGMEEALMMGYISF